MNMQDVASLAIPEGEVKSIHDKDNKLLWGRLNYDTKYNGNTFQQTYSGKNLFNVNGDFSYGSTHHDIVSNGDGTLTTTSNIAVFRSSGQKIEGLLPNTEYTLTATITSYTGDKTSGKAGEMEVLDSSGGSNVLLKNLYFGQIGSLPETASMTFTTTANVSATWVSFNGTALNSSSPLPSVIFSDIQLEKGSIKTSFEPYVGGIPSPNPDYPQDVQVVTGEQTVTIGDGVESQSYPISLGSLELCKIGDYQDYIYKSGDDWYVHKETERLAASSSQNWGYNAGGAGLNNPRFYLLNVNAKSGTFSPDSPIMAMSNCLNGSTWYRIYGGQSDNLVSTGDQSNLRRLYVQAKTFTSLQDWKDFIDDNDVYIYYVLETAVNVQITDATLISQLDAVHQWLTRYGYNATVSGNLPLIVDRTNI